MWGQFIYALSIKHNLYFCPEVYCNSPSSALYRLYTNSGHFISNCKIWISNLNWRKHQYQYERQKYVVLKKLATADCRNAIEVRVQHESLQHIIIISYPLKAYCRVENNTTFTLQKMTDTVAIILRIPPFLDGGQHIYLHVWYSFWQGVIDFYSMDLTW